MTNYARMYRFGITPWERYATAAASSIAAYWRGVASGISPPSRPRLLAGLDRQPRPGVARSSCAWLPKQPAR